MSSIAITQLPVPGETPTDIQVLKVYPKTGKLNLLFNSEGERKNDSTTKPGTTLNFALMESDTGEADAWNLISKTGTAKTATVSASSALGTALTVDNVTGITAGDKVAVQGAVKPRVNGVFDVISASATTLVIDLPWLADNASSDLAGTVTEVAPITVAPGGQENASVATQKKFLKVVGWGTEGGGYCRMDIQFNGKSFFGQVDIEVHAQKTGYGYFGNGAAGVGGMGRDTAWPEVP